MDRMTDLVDLRDDLGSGEVEDVIVSFERFVVILKLLPWKHSITTSK